MQVILFFPSTDYHKSHKCVAASAAFTEKRIKKTSKCKTDETTTPAQYQHQLLVQLSVTLMAFQNFRRLL